MASRLIVRFRTTVASNTRGHRDQLLQETLRAHGFSVAASNGWSASSQQIDGQDLKALLRRQGFADHEFRIRMEFQRGWGCL